jgi:hypothetical protein
MNAFRGIVLTAIAFAIMGYVAGLSDGHVAGKRDGISAAIAEIERQTKDPTHE